MSNKTIKINPVFFHKHSKTTKKKEKKPIVYNPLNSNKIKTSFIKKIKEFKKSKAEEEKKEINNTSQSINVNSNKNEFDESIGFINSLIKENKNKNETREKIKNAPIHLDFPQQTTKNTNVNTNIENNLPIHSSLQPHIIQSSIITPQINNSQQFNNPTNIVNKNLQMKPTSKKKIYLPKKRKTIKLGKIKNKNIISILIPNQNDKKNVENFKRTLKNNNINKIKKYLKKHGLIKSGCIAPKNILREIYENALLTGEVYNNSKETLIHNFMSID